MRILQSSKNKLTLQYRPLSSRGIGLLLGVFAFTLLSGKIETEITASEYQVLSGFISLFIGIGLLLLSDSITIKVNLFSQTITITRKNLLFPARQMHLHLTQVQGIEIHLLYEKLLDEYKLCLRLQSGKSISLMSAKSWSPANTRAMAHKLGQFIDKPVSEKFFGWASLK